MPIPLPNLDDRQFADLVAEMRARIARYAPEWTNHNIADPGIMLLELFAWQTEAFIYRINRVPDESRIRFLQMLGGMFEPAQPATVKFKLRTRELTAPWTMPRNTVLMTRPYVADGVLLFETLRDVTVTKPPEGETIAYVTARQTALVENELLGTSDGTKFQLFELAQPFIVLPNTPPPVLPKVNVAGESWTYRPNFSESEPGDKHFTIKVWLNAVAFGDGERGSKPPKGARITVSYHHEGPISGLMEEGFDSSGKPYQYYRLSEQLLARDLKQRSVLEPLIVVYDENGENGELWQYRTRVTDMTADAHEFTVEPARNSVRFGDGDYGEIPPAGATIRATYRYTQRPLRPILPGSEFLIASPQPGNPAPGDLEIEVDQVITPGSNATNIDEAHTQAHNILKPRWRTISTSDFETIVENSGFDIARARCLPGRNVDAPVKGVGSTGHVSVVVVPGARHMFDLETHRLDEVLDFGPGGSCIVGLDGDKRGWLVLLEKQDERIDLGLFSEEAVRQVAFSPSGESLITSGDDNVPILRSTRTGRELAEFVTGSAVGFSPTGSYIVEIADAGGAFLWDARDATIIFSLSQENRVKSVVFGANDRLVASSSAESGNNVVHLWETAGGVKYGALSHPGQVVAMVFTPDGEQLITAVEDGEIFLWQTKSAQLRAKIIPDQAIRDLIVSGDGTRLVTYDDRQAWLWSTRSRRKMVDEALGTDIVAVHFSPDSSWLAVTHEDGVIGLWDAKRGDAISTFDHGATIQQLTFSPNSQRLVTLTNDPYTLRIWDLRIAREKFAPLEIGSDLSAAAIGEDGSWFCYADDNLLRLWSTEEMKQISVMHHDHTYLYPDRTHAPITEVQGIAHGKYLYVMSKDEDVKGLVHIWNAKHVPDVDHLVNDRRLVTSEHHVAGPTYTDVYVEAEIAPSQHSKTEGQLQQDATGALYEFFHPLRGGPDGQGWPWGRDVYASEIYQILEGVEGVDHVELLALHARGADPDSEQPVERGGATSISIAPFHLVNFVVDETVIACTG